MAAGDEALISSYLAQASGLSGNVLLDYRILRDQFPGYYTVK